MAQVQKKFISNLGLLLLLNFLIKPFWIFGIDRTVQNVVGAESYGTYFFLLNFTLLFNIVLDFGITNFNNRNIAQNQQLLNKHFSNLLLLKCLLGVVYFIVLYIFAWMIGYAQTHFTLLLLLGLNQFLSSFILYLRSNVTGLMMFRTESILSVLDRALMIVFCALLLWGNLGWGPMRIEWFIYAQTSAYTLTALAAMVIVMRKAAFRRLNWNWAFSLMVIRKSLPFALLVILMFFHGRIDSVMLERILGGAKGAQQVGLYASAFRLLDASVMVAYLFSILLLPIFANQIKEKVSPGPIFRLSFSLLITFSLLVALTSFFYRHEMMALLYKQHIPESASIFGILMFSFIPLSVVYVVGTLLTAGGRLKELNLVSAGGMVLGIILNFFLIPVYQAYGSAMASLISQSAVAAAQVLIAFSLWPGLFQKSFWLKLPIMAIAFILCYFLLALFSLPWIISITLILLIMTVLAFLMGLFSFRGLIEILQRNR